jgi:hypothetical protein
VPPVPVLPVPPLARNVDVPGGGVFCTSLFFLSLPQAASANATTIIIRTLADLMTYLL